MDPGVGGLLLHGLAEPGGGGFGPLHGGIQGAGAGLFGGKPALQFRDRAAQPGGFRGLGLGPAFQRAALCLSHGQRLHQRGGLGVGFLASGLGLVQAAVEIGAVFLQQGQLLGGLIEHHAQFGGFVPGGIE